MDDEEATALFRQFRDTDDRPIRNKLVEHYEWIARTCAHRFRDRGEPLDDLIQVGLLGLVKAVIRFDPENGTPFPGFAIPTVTGELRRHFRDTTWAVHVPRRMKEMAAAIGPARELLQERLGRHPTLQEIATELRVEVEDVIGGMEASSGYRAGSIHSDRDGGPMQFGAEDEKLGQTEAQLAVERLLATLPEREQTILRLRFMEDKSQAEIAEVVSISQVHVSRLIRSALTSLRRHLPDDGEIVAALTAHD